MERMIRNLGVLLAVQLVLAVGVMLLRPGLPGTAPASALLAVTPTAVDQVTIDGDGKTTTLQLKDKKWSVEQLSGFEADQARVSGLVDRIAGLKRGLALATSAGALKRFKVADDGFDRKITLGGGGKTLGTLYLGTSIDARHANGRAGGDNAVYSLGLASFEVPAAPGDWADKTVLQVPRADVASITIGALALARADEASKGAAAAAVEAKPDGAKPDVVKAAAGAAPPAGSWQASAGISGAEHVDSAAVDRLGDALAQLQVGAPLGTESKPEYGLGAPALDLALKRKDGTTVDYALGKKQGSGDYVIKSSLRPEYFSLPGYEGEQLLNVAKRETLVKGDTAAAPTPPAAANGAPQHPGPAPAPAKSS